MRLVAPGPPDHGVVRHSATLARLLRGGGVHVVDDASVADIVHVQFTDALWGPDIATAAARFTEWAATVRVPLVVTLHDLPGGDVDPRRDERRCRGYTKVLAAADVVVVSAAHEAAKVAAMTGQEAAVVGLPVEPVPCGPRPDWADRPTLGVLGFVYPGKGHADVVRVAACLPERPRVVAAGAVSPGHESVRAKLENLAATLRVELVLTGRLDDAAMGAAAHAVTVPVVPGRAVSASGTLATWWAAGRRPLVAAGVYATEQARAFPDALVLYERRGLATAAATALARPAATVLAGPRAWPDAGAAHLRVYASVQGVRC
ncbi:MAG: hypothetical protein J0I34_24875 [Pseudonocardia sp.]|uniref:hypothetical protein n=1 Tax=unclassified Pseudonocardia TaxID=2619320 RepID=UPI000869FD2F|nr:MULTISPECIES: hypothetical protein [unclassified Pseudonocardia]MBN9112004.1 hypothetical protein [Pseudonocardia sp.]ODU25976.1 MAG: hypothetical protein ABS80_08445 [Pseudonocardia sp. SCN 72-51]ODV06069.1 MAG: hypothetical protein ABT15_14770 [Pseudonocardia sp. SCN 73-27]